jgi:hypothetical protein
MRTELTALARAIQNATFDIEHYREIVRAGGDQRRRETIRYLRAHRRALRVERGCMLFRLVASFIIHPRAAERATHTT